MTKLNTILAGLLATIGMSAANAFVTPFDVSVAQSTKNRAEVQAQAVNRAADTFVSPVDSTPNRSGLTRVQVRAEALEALRLGLIDRGQASTVVTPAQAEQIRMAGERAIAAVHSSVSAAR